MNIQRRPLNSSNLQSLTNRRSLALRRLLKGLFVSRAGDGSMEQNNLKPLVAAEYMTFGGFDKSALGDVISSLSCGDLKQVAGIAPSVQIISSAVSATLDCVVRNIEGSSLEKEETERLTEILYLLSSLSQLCSNAGTAIEDARAKLVRGGETCH